MASQKPDSFYEQKLTDFGFKLNDLVTFDNKRNPASQAGGVIYRIVTDTSPQRIAVSKKSVGNSPYNRYRRIIPAKNAEGKKVSCSESEGCIRCTPVFEFFATTRGKKPGGAGKTMIVTYKNLKFMKKVDIVDIGTKYLELGNFLKDVAKQAGMQSDEPDTKESR